MRKIEKNEAEIAVWLHPPSASLAEAFLFLQNYFCRLNSKWIVYKTVFGTSEKRIDLLNDASGPFFGVAQRAIYDSILLDICKLIDRSASGRHENCSIYYVKDLVCCSETKDKLSAFLAESKTDFDALKKLRDKRIAHLDVKHHVGGNAEGLEGISRKKIQNCIDLLSDAFNVIENRYRGSTSCYEHTLSAGSVERVLFLLRDALKVESSFSENDKEKFGLANYSVKTLD